MKIIDCFLFYNELELLKFKLKELNDIVDYFVLIESKYTFVGNEKELYYEKNKVLFSEYNHKIIHVIHDHNATTENSPRDDGLPNAWYNEKEQRFYGTKGISKLDLADDDLIILSDLDEIVDKNTLKKIKEEGLEEPIYCLEQYMYYYNLNNRLKDKWYQSKILNYKTYKEYIDNVTKFNTIVRPEFNPDGKHIGYYPIIKNGGWHFSFFGDSARIKNKIQQFAHTELAHFGDESDDEINEKIQNNKDIFDREDMKFESIKIEDNDYLPENYKMLI
jgi:beta-1,4-mannosyl-glycoprotein beta-1,4-N-acetylglucosaminyltransferase